MAAAQGTAATGMAAEETRETRKLFVGGVPSTAKEADLQGHFARFGELRSVVLMRDRETGHGRGFGFVEFEDEDAAARALGDGDKPLHYICGRQVDVKMARTRQPRYQDNQPPAKDVSYESKKIFIGGLRDNVTEEEFRAYFDKFGTVTDVVVIVDSLTNRSRGFGFITFDSEEAVNKVMRQSFHNLNGTKVEVKIAIPKDEQYCRNSQGRGGRSFGVRGPVHFEGPMYQPYNAGYGLYNGYMPQPLPVHPFYPAPNFPVGGYSYGSVYPSQGVMTNVPGMMARRVPPVYGAYPQLYPGFNIVSQGGFGDSATFQYGFNGGSDKQNDQTTVDMQDFSTASIATKLEHMKLGSQ